MFPATLTTRLIPRLFQRYKKPAVKPETATRLKDKILDALFLSMILISVIGLIYNFVHR